MRSQYAFDYLLTIAIGLAVLTIGYAVVYTQLINTNNNINSLTYVFPKAISFPYIYYPQSYLCDGYLIEKTSTGISAIKIGNYSLLLSNGGTYNLVEYEISSKDFLLYREEPVAGINLNYVFNPVNKTLFAYIEALNDSGKETKYMSVNGNLEIYNASSNSIIYSKNLTLVNGRALVNISLASINNLVIYYSIENEPLSLSQCLQNISGIPIIINSAQNVSNLQVPILIPKTYFSLINLTPSGSGQNVKFEYDNGTQIYTWYEGNNSQYAVWWAKVNLHSGNNTIFAITGPLNTNYLNGISVGRAFYLGGNYDNGESVFDFYYPSFSYFGWKTVGVSGVTSSAPSGSPVGTHAAYANGSKGDYMYTYVPNLPANNFIIDYYGYTPELEDIFYDVNATGYGQMLRVGNGSSGFGDTDTLNWTDWNCPTGDISFKNAWGLVQLYVNSTGYPFLDIWYNPTTLLGTQGSPTATNNGFSGGCNVGTVPSKVTQYGKYIGLVGDAAGSSYRSYYQLLIIRNAPPNGVMPKEFILG